VPSSVARFAKQVARRAARAGPFGGMVARAANAAGATGLSRRVSGLCDYVPDRVQLDVTDRRGNARRGWMHGAGGNDAVVKKVWLSGWDDYERPLPAVYAAAVKLTDGAVLEVGANSGLYVVAASLLDDPGRVHAFEPFPPALRSLEANLELNDLRERVAVVPKACGAESGEAKMYIPARKHGDVLETSASLRFDFKGQHSGEIAVPVTTVDRYVAGAGLDRVGLMKLDVEGFEGPAMRGAAETLRTRRPLVFVEVLAWKTEAPELELIRADAGYRAVWMEATRLVERPAVEVCPDGDNQLWYPEERRDLFLQVAEAAKVPVQSL
jgi:FkbM family methyltransferase